MRTLTDEDVEAIAAATAQRVLDLLHMKLGINPDAIYTVEEASKLLGRGMSVKTLHRLLDARILTGKRLSPRGSWRIRGSELFRLTGNATPQER